MTPEQFLSALAGDFRTWNDRYLWVAGFACSPEQATNENWAGYPLNSRNNPPVMGMLNGYFSVGVFNAPRRVAANQIEAFVLVLDDIDTDGLNDLPLHPTYIVETSPGNHHVGFGITDRENVAGFALLQKRLIAAGRMSADKSGNNSNRYVRLPGYINNKAEVIEEHGEPFITRLVEFAPERRYTVAELARYFSVSLDEAAKNTTATNGEGREAGAELMRRMMTGVDYHDPHVVLSARWAQHGNMDQREAVELLQGAMLANPDRSPRWQDRYSDIPRTVASAWEKFRKPPAPSAPSFHRVSLADVFTNPPPPQEFVWGGYIPRGTLTLLNAHGGTGKSMLGLQLAAHYALGRAFCGHPTARTGRVLFFSAEDTEKTVRDRFAEICRADQLDPEEVEKQMIALDATDAPTLYQECAKGRGEKTAGYDALARMIEAEDVQFLIVDNASDVYDCDPIDRRRVGEFVRLLMQLVKARDGTILLLAHVNRTTANGFAAKKETYADSAAWHNKARSRLYLSADEQESALLKLEHQKCNLGPLQPPLELFMRTPGGVQCRADVSALLPDGAPAVADPTGVVVGLIGELYNLGQFISPHRTARNNAFKMLRTEPRFPRSIRTLDQLQPLLLTAQRGGLIEIEEYRTAQRKPAERWRVCAPSAPSAHSSNESANGACGAPSAPTWAGGVGESARANEGADDRAEQLLESVA